MILVKLICRESEFEAEQFEPIKMDLYRAILFKNVFNNVDVPRSEDVVPFKNFDFRSVKFIFRVLIVRAFSPAQNRYKNHGRQMITSWFKKVRRKFPQSHFVQPYEIQLAPLLDAHSKPPGIHFLLREK